MLAGTYGGAKRAMYCVRRLTGIGRSYVLTSECRTSATTTSSHVRITCVATSSATGRPSRRPEKRPKPASATLCLWLMSCPATTGCSSRNITSRIAYSCLFLPLYYSTCNVFTFDFCAKNCLNSYDSIFVINFIFIFSFWNELRETTKFWFMTLMTDNNHRQQGATWIVKPVAKSRGRGIFLFRKLKSLVVWKSREVKAASGQQLGTSTETYVVQRYIDNPYLVAGPIF